MLTTRRPGLFAAVLLAGGLVAGCGGDEDACDYVVCAIGEQSCVERVAVAVGCHLGQTIITPTVRSMTAEEYLAEYADEPLTAEEQRDVDDGWRVDALVGLMPEGYSAAEANEDYLRNFVAFYSSEDKEIVLLSDRSPIDEAAEYGLLVHEMVHAYDDAAWDLQALNEAHATTFDRFLGLRALTEGHAVLYQYLARVELDGLEPFEIDWDRFFGGWQDESMENAQTSKTPYLDVLAFFPYSFGGKFMFEAWQDGGTARIDDVRETPPDSVRQVYQGYWQWPEGNRNEDAAFDPQAVAVMPANYELLFGGHEGVWLVNAMLQRTVSQQRWYSEMAHVSADYLAAWRRGEDDVVAMWRIRSELQDSLYQVLTGPGSMWKPAETEPSTHVVAKVGKDVLLIAVNRGDANLVLAEVAGWQSPDEAFPESEAAAPRWQRRLDTRRLGCAPLR